MHLIVNCPRNSKILDYQFDNPRFSIYCTPRIENLGFSVDNPRCWSPNVQLRRKTRIIECPWAGTTLSICKRVALCMLRFFHDLFCSMIIR